MAQMPESVRQFIDSALSIMQRHSRFTTHLRRPAVRQKTCALAATAKKPRNVQPDKVVIGGDDFFNHGNDKKIKAVVAWIKKQDN